MSAMTILDTSIRQDAQGRFCLNDLHRAAGGEARHSPNRFTRTATFKELLEVLTPEMASAPMTTIAVGRPGIYVCRELVYAYAMWISARFHLAVIRAFDAMQVQRINAAVLPSPQPDYMAEAWFAILRHQAGCMVHRALARALQIHESTLSQVLGGTGHYGTGRCTTSRIARRVLRVFCPRQRVHVRQLSLV